MVESSSEGAELVALLAPSGDGDELRGRPGMSLAYLSSHVVTIHAAHADIEQRYVRSERRERDERRRTVMDDGHFMSIQLEERRERLGRIAIIVGDQDSPTQPATRLLGSSRRLRAHFCRRAGW